MNKKFVLVKNGVVVYETQQYRRMMNKAFALSGTVKVYRRRFTGFGVQSVFEADMVFTDGSLKFIVVTGQDLTSFYEA